MARFFNTTGPCYPERHYFLPPASRLRHSRLERYIKDQLYWVLHAPRQTGKTTFLQTWMREINESEQAIACYVSVEVCQGIPEVERAIPGICEAVCDYASKMLPREYVPTLSKDTTPIGALSDLMTRWAELCAPKPLVVLFDEVDTLEGPAMISFLRQLRGGFASRGTGKFPVSVALVGMRDLRDYLAQSKDGTPVNPGSPFNIKQDSATLGNFTRDDVVALLGQHTSESGQVFQPDAVEAIWYWSQGQPFLVNALANKCVWDITNDDPAIAITGEMVLEAKELLIQSRTTHLDALAERLKQPQVKKVIETILVGDPSVILGRDDRGVELCMDLGLVAWSRDEGLHIANPLYREVVPRVLNQAYHDTITKPEFRWQFPDGRLDMDALLREFQRFWRRHADLWEAKADYTEAFPHLLLMAYFQRIMNGGGRITREYAAGRGRIDLFVEYSGEGFVVETKLVHPHDGRDTTLQEALRQVGRYRETVGGATVPAWVVLFDRTESGRKLSWDERLSWTVHETPGGPVTVVGA